MAASPWRSGLVLGLMLERGVLRLVYGRDEVLMVLVTYAAFLILEDVVILIWGTGSYATYQPLLAAGNMAVGELILSNYDLGLIVIAALLAGTSYWALKYTRYGRLLTAVIFDREIAAAFGINVRAVYTVTFVIGAMLGALGGAIMAPNIAVTLGIGVEVIVLAFAVVVIGGLGRSKGRCSAPSSSGSAALPRCIWCRRSSCSSSMASCRWCSDPALWPVLGPAEKNLTMARARPDRSEFGLPGGRGRSLRAAGLDDLARHHRLCERSGGARLDRAVAGRPRLVRTGAVLLHRRLCRGAGRPLDRHERCLRVGTDWRGPRPAWFPSWWVSCWRATAKSSSRCSASHCR